jgi:Protein of unknown function (DUF3352)
VSSDLPPSGPPAPPPPPPTPPPFGGPGEPVDPAAEVLEHGSGARLGRSGDGGSGRGLRTGLFIAGGAIGLAAVGVGAWAAWSFLTTGPQPAEALPANTLAYASVDLDPSGGQKVEALRTLNKFPAFEDEVGIGTDDDVRKALVEKILEEAPCDDLTWADDFEPWLGDRAAVAAVDLGGDRPDAVLVVQVKDAAAAEDGLAAIKECDAEGDDTGGDGRSSDEDTSGGWVIEGDWAVVAENEETARKISDAAQDGSLADDEDFQRWTEEAGDAGIVTMYAGPEAGDWVADHAEEFLGFPFGGSTECLMEPETLLEESYGSDGSVDGCADEGLSSDSEGELLPDGFEQRLRDFEGAAVTVRFDDGAIEVEAAGDKDLMGYGLLGGGGGADAMSTLPADTAAAFGAGFDEGWFTSLMEYAAPFVGGTGDVDELIADMEDQSGLELPEDVETLLGDSAVLSVGSDLDPNAFFESSDGSDVPIALKVKGDPEEIEAVLEKLRAQFPPDEASFIDSDSEGDVIVIGPNADYREHILGEGDLGDDDVFKDVVREADAADVVFFVNVNELEGAIEDLAEGDESFAENLEPLSGFGSTGWTEDDVAHGVLRITTD